MVGGGRRELCSPIAVRSVNAAHGQPVAAMQHCTLCGTRTTRFTSTMKSMTTVPMRNRKSPPRETSGAP